MKMLHPAVLALFLFMPAAALAAGFEGLPNPVYLLAPAVADENGNRRPPEKLWPQLTVEKLEHVERSKDCLANYLKFTVYYPQGLGNQAVDLEIENQMKARLDEDIELMRDDGFCDRESCGGMSCGAWEDTRTFSLYSPSADFISLLFQEYSFTGGAHGNINYENMNFNLRTGQRLTLTDFFPDPDRSVPLYWAYVYEQWCRQSEYKYPPHYQDLQPCGREDGPGETNNFAGARTIDDLGRLILTPTGASLILEPYESGSYASGTAVVDLPRAELLRMGASPAIWGQN